MVMESLRREAARPYVPSGTLELNFPPPLYRWVPTQGGGYPLPGGTSSAGCAGSLACFEMGFVWPCLPAPQAPHPWSRAPLPAAKNQSCTLQSLGSETNGLNILILGGKLSWGAGLGPLASLRGGFLRQCLM